MCLFTFPLHTVSRFPPFYFIATSEQLVILECFHCPCPRPRILTRKPPLLCVVLYSQVCTIFVNSPPNYPSLFFWKSNASNVVNIVPEVCFQFSLLSEICHPWQSRWIFRPSWKIKTNVKALKRIMKITIISLNKLLHSSHTLCGQIWLGFVTHCTSVASFQVNLCILWIKICQIHSTTWTQSNRK